MIRTMVWFFIVAAVLGCRSDEGEYRNAKSRNPPREASRSEAFVHETSGKFQEIDVDGDYSVLLLRNQTGATMRFIFVADSILENEPRYQGKMLRVSWREEAFEEAGSGEKFKARFLLGISILQ